MATFAKSSFSAATYATFRPTYPNKVYQTVLSYHQGRKALAIDLGCGHGTVTRTLAPSFTSIVGTDPSSRMIDQAQSTTTLPNVSFHTGYAQDLSFVEDGTVDLICAAEAAHWFDYSKVWPVLARKLRKGGTLAFWMYKDNVFVDYPHATKVLDRYCYQLGVGLMGEHWEQPGRSILRNKLREVVPPKEEFENVQRIEYEPGTQGKGSGEGEVLIRREAKLGEMEGYLRTFSAYVNWKDANPERKARAEGGEGDVIDDLFDEMRNAEPKWAEQGDAWKDLIVESEWGSAILLARKK